MATSWRPWRHNDSNRPMLSWLQKLFRSRPEDDEGIGRRLRRELASESEAQLVARLLECDYFDLESASTGRSLRDHPKVAAFLERVRAGDYRALADEMNRHFTDFVAAERETGFTGRPYLIDYDRYMAALVRELARRSASEK